MALKTMQSIMNQARLLDLSSSPPTHHLPHNHAHSSSTPCCPPSSSSTPSDPSNPNEILLLHISHRLGSVPPGSTSIVVACSSAHRRASFEVCEWMLEEVKRKVQVWKREVYANGGGVLDESTGEGVGRGDEREAGTQDEAEGVWKENFKGGRWDKAEGVRADRGLHAGGAVDS
jgi:molybdopterin synthase catalytic subunit